MSTPDDDPDHDDLDPTPVPGPDDEPSAAERARARAFAELVDKVVAGRAPAAMSAEDRTLIEAATVIRAGTRPVQLPLAKRDALIERALAGALQEPPAVRVATSVIPIETRRASSLRARAPWLIAGASTLVAAAAVLAMWLRPVPHPAAPPVAKAPVPSSWRSRPADRLIGVIPRERDGDASARIDAIFADRLDGYRDRTLQGGTR